MWRTPVMPAPAFWYFDSREEAEETARAFYFSGHYNPKKSERREIIMATENLSDLSNLLEDPFPDLEAIHVPESPEEISETTKRFQIKDKQAAEWTLR